MKRKMPSPKPIHKAAGSPLLTNQVYKQSPEAGGDPHRSELTRRPIKQVLCQDDALRCVALAYDPTVTHVPFCLINFYFIIL